MEIPIRSESFAIIANDIRKAENESLIDPLIDNSEFQNSLFWIATACGLLGTVVLGIALGNTGDR